MKLLLDTHVLLGWLGDMLSAEARELIADPAHVVFVSAVSAWEIEIKKATGKLDAPDDLKAAVRENGFEPLPISMDHAIAAGRLPLHHGDTFDRMLVAQAALESMTIVTRDPRIPMYDIRTIRA